MVIWKQVRDIHLLIPEELLAEIDAAATQNYMSRSEYIRRVMHKDVSGKFPKVIAEITRDDPTRFLDIGDS